MYAQIPLWRPFMSRRTKKVGISGRYGARYGLRVRKVTMNIEKQQKAKHECPQCSHMAVKRVSKGIWECRKCGYKFAGGAFYPQTAAAKSRKLVLSKLKEGE